MKVFPLLKMFAQSKDFHVRCLEWCLAIALAGSIIVPRLSWFFLASLAIISATQLFPNIKTLKKIKPGRDICLALAGLGAFLLYVFASILWSSDAYNASLKLVAVVNLYVLTLIVLVRVSTLSTPDLKFLKRGIFFGFLLGASYYAIEVFTNGVLITGFINLIGNDLDLTVKYPIIKNGKVAYVNIVVFNHSAIAVSLFAWSALAIWPQNILPKHLTTLLLSSVFAATSIAFFYSVNESAKLAVLLGFVTFLIALYSTQISTAIVVASWIAATLLVLPASELAYRAKLHESDWIQISGQQRIEIWKAAHDLFWHHPILGAGIRAAQTKSQTLPVPDDVQAPSLTGVQPGHHMAHHAHNSFLQIWYELGLIGAALFCAAGLFIIKALGGKSTKLYPHGHAFVISTVTVLGLSYGFWQTWYQSILLLAIITYYTSVGLVCDVSKNEPPSL